MNTSKITLIALTLAAFSSATFAADKPVDKIGGKKHEQHCDHDMKAGSKAPLVAGEPCDHADCKNMPKGAPAAAEAKHEHKGMMGGDMKGKHRGMSGMYDPDMFLQSPMLNMARAMELSNEQQAKLDKLADTLRHDNWAAMGAMMDEGAKLRELYAADKRSPTDISQQYQKIFDLQRKMIETMVTLEVQAEEALTPEQRAQVKKMHKKMGAMMR